MSLKITDLEGFVIGGVLNTSITEIYVRANISMCKGKQKPAKNEQGVVDHISIYTEANATILGGIFDNSVQIDGISPIYWTKYSTIVEDMNAQYLEVEEDLKAKILEVNPTWTIEIINMETI
jgi:hypothetical protein